MIYKLSYELQGRPIVECREELDLYELQRAVQRCIVNYVKIEMAMSADDLHNLNPE